MKPLVGRFKCVRGVVVDGRKYAAGDRIEFSDGEIIGLLLASGKIEPADSRTKAAIRWEEPATWSKGEPHAREPWMMR